MDSFYDRTEYDKYLEAFASMENSNNLFKKAFQPYLWFMDVKLYDCAPCKYCDNMNYYHRGTSVESECLNRKKCENCMILIKWEGLCASKLAYFESRQAVYNVDIKPG